MGVDSRPGKCNNDGEENCMSITQRPYQGIKDYWRVDRFLIEHYQPGNADGNWLEPAWEYMHSHSFLDKSSLAKIRIWEDDGRMAAVAHYEWQLGEAFFQFHPDYRYLREEMLIYAEAHLFGLAKNSKRYLKAYINDNDEDFIDLVRTRGYQKDEEERRPLYRYDLPQQFPAIPLPEGYHLKSMADDCDWMKIHRVLWRGFNHPGEPLAEDLDDRKTMQDTPNFRHDLKIVVEAPNGDFASFCGMWYQPDHRYAYVEPVATDPAYRRMGLGKAAVLEGIRRCGELGAEVAYVGSDQAVYQAIGFKKVFISECWVKP
jgi:ribosomal protein S18 acetylase RimI-like enzyme